MKTLATLTAASVLALAGIAAHAQTAPTPPAAPPAQGAAPAPDARPAPNRDERRPRLTRADMEALTDARVAAIRAGLKLNADQERLWTPVEQALRAQANQRIARMEERRTEMERRRAAGPQQQSQAEPDLMARLDQRAARATENAERLRTFAGAMKPFWGSLDENQKRLLPVLMRTATGGEGRGWRRGGDDHHRGMRHGGYDHHRGDGMRQGGMQGGPRWL
jgi:hypothetical protein